MIQSMASEELRQFAMSRAAPPKTAVQHAVDWLREAILTGVLREGQPLAQNDLAEALGTSRMPVREALRILETEGWVEAVPNRGACVAMLSPDDAREIFEIRFTLESLALRKSVPTTDPAVFDEAEEVLRKLDFENDIARWVQLNRRFHLLFYGGAGARLLELINSQYDAVERYLRIELAEMNNAEESQQEHRAILEACRSRDVERAVALSEPHIYEAGLELAAALAKRLDSAG